MLRILAASLLFLLLSACSKEPAASDPQAATEPEAAEVTVAESPAESGPEDPYLWLEDVGGEKALEWVEEQNDVSLTYLEALPNFQPLFERNLEIYNSDERIPYPDTRGDYVYNYWKDADHKRGLWRRVTMEAYLAGKADWEIVLDLDAWPKRKGKTGFGKARPACARNTACAC